jgi:hypothetical protein
MHPAGLNTTAFEPSDLAFLQRIYDHLCNERGVPDDTLAATDLAANIIVLYQQGVRSETDLQSRLDTLMFQPS